MKKFHLLAATAISVIALPACAQDASPTAAAQTTAGTDDYESANDIVVTATRRNETVQSVPSAITAIGAEQLNNARVTDIRGIMQAAPSVKITQGQSAAGATVVNIRGLGTGGDNPGFEPAVGTFIDGVFRARAGLAVSELPELQRVEVLRGPQGTLFGRNTSAGALSIYTAQPKFELGGYGEASYGNYDAIEAKGAITGPVSEQIALRLDGGYRKRDGYIRDANSNRAINDLNRWYVRGQALYDASTVTFRLIGDYYETDEHCCGALSVVRGSLAPAIIGIAGAQGLTGLYTGPLTNRTMAISPNREYAERVKDWGLSGELNVDLGGFKLTSITAYRDWRVLRKQDIDFSGIDRAYRDGYRNELADFTQELRLQGTVADGLLDLLVGGFYLNEANNLTDTVRFGNDANRYVDTLLNAATRSAALPSGAQFFGASLTPAPLFGQVLLAQNPFVAPGVRLGDIAPPGSALFTYLNTPLTGNPAGSGNNNDLFRVKTDAFAIFTHNIVHLSDKLSLTLGARYNHETKNLTASINNTTPGCGFFTSADPRAVTYRALIKGADPSGALFKNLFLLACNPAVNSEFNGNYSDRSTEGKVTGTAKLAYAVTPRLLVYGSYDRGYKSGGYNLDQATFDSTVLGGNGAQGSDLHFGAETVDAYEIGFKSEISRRFTLNAAAFLQKVKGFQDLSFAGNNFVVTNIQGVTTKGVEVEAILQPTRDLRVQLGYTYLDARYDASNVFPANSPLLGSAGLRLANQPEHVVVVASNWTPRLSSNLSGLVYVDMRYTSEVNTPSGGLNPVTGRTAVYNQGYPLINAQIGIQTSDLKKSLTFFVQNLTNQLYYYTAFPVPEQTGNYNGYPSQPRFYGVRARFGF